MENAWIQLGFATWDSLEIDSRSVSYGKNNDLKPLFWHKHYVNLQQILQCVADRDPAIIKTS